MNMYSKFHYNWKGEKHLKLGAKKVSGEGGEDRFQVHFFSPFFKIQILAAL